MPWIMDQDISLNAHDDMDDLFLDDQPQEHHLQAVFDPWRARLDELAIGGCSQ